MTLSNRFQQQKKHAPCPAKTRQQIAHEYGVTRHTFAKWLKKEKIKLSSGMVFPKDVRLIYEQLGDPREV